MWIICKEYILHFAIAAGLFMIGCSFNGSSSTGNHEQDRRMKAVIRD